MKKLAKAQAGKIVSSVLKKRPFKQVAGGVGAIATGIGSAATYGTIKAKKEFAESQAKKMQEEAKKKTAKPTTAKSIKKTGGIVKPNKKK